MLKIEPGNFVLDEEGDWHLVSQILNGGKTLVCNGLGKSCEYSVPVDEVFSVDPGISVIRESLNNSNKSLVFVDKESARYSSGDDTKKMDLYLLIPGEEVPDGNGGLVRTNPQLIEIVRGLSGRFKIRTIKMVGFEYQLDGLTLAGEMDKNDLTVSLTSFEKPITTDYLLNESTAASAEIGDLLFLSSQDTKKIKDLTFDELLEWAGKTSKERSEHDKWYSHLGDSSTFTIIGA